MTFKQRPPAPQSIDEILDADDEQGLLRDVQPSLHQSSPRGNDSTVNNFLEILDFVRAKGREPDISQLSERSLARKLEKYRKDARLRAAVAKWDTPGLLGDNPDSKKADTPSLGVQAPGVQDTPGRPSTMDDILNSDTLGLLDDINYDIFNLEHVEEAKSPDARDVPDIIGRQRPCEDFDSYRELFDTISGKLNTPSVIQRQFTSESSLRPGQFFILRGQICYISAKLHDGYYRDRENPRLLLIFDNHTEIEILKLSLARALHADKQSKWLDCSPNLFSPPSLFSRSFANTGKHSAENLGEQSHTPSGYIYILKTLSEAPALARWKHSNSLVKIGYTTTTLEERLRNAEKDRTYLCAPVSVAAAIQCSNMNVRMFEQLIHAYLNSQRLNVELVDANGHTYRPQEWFTVSPDTACEIARRIVDGSIRNFRMNNTTGKLVAKERD